VGKAAQTAELAATPATETADSAPERVQMHPHPDGGPLILGTGKKAVRYDIVGGFLRVAPEHVEACEAKGATRVVDAPADGA
jgi:hypothetical protein